jgi:4-hydroxy-2-oxoheptanedioate aldolase
VLSARYAPEGIRGVSLLTRATRFGRVEDYFPHAFEEICVIVQVETEEALNAIEEIAAVDGVDGIFVGPADLAASLGYPGQPTHSRVPDVVENSIRRIRASGKPAGVLTPDVTFAGMNSASTICASHDSLRMLCS